jgi:HPt (histidine-containing phosphotransfer) domain-containing protein
MKAGRPSPPVDLKGFRSAMREAGVEEIVEPTLQVFVAEAATIFTALVEAVASGASETARTAAHSLKSSSANVRATVLAELLERLETVAVHGDIVEVRQLFERVRGEYEEVIAFLAESTVG